MDLSNLVGHPHQKMKNFSWHEWKMPNFHIDFTHQFNHAHSCCGGCCVSMITGEAPIKIDRKMKWSEDATTGKMIRCLESKGFDVMKVGLRAVSDSRQCCAWNNESLTEEHLLLIGAMTDAKEASWFLLHQGIVWHNFSRWSNSPLFLLNNAPEDVLLIRK